MRLDAADVHRVSSVSVSLSPCRTSLSFEGLTGERSASEVVSTTAAEFEVSADSRGERGGRFALDAVEVRSHHFLFPPLFLPLPLPFPLPLDFPVDAARSGAVQEEGVGHTLGLWRQRGH